MNHLKSTAPILLGALWVEVGEEELARRAVDFAREAFCQSAAMLSMTVNIDLADAIARGDVKRMRACIEEFEGLRGQQISEVSRAEHAALSRMAWVFFGERLRHDLEPPAMAPLQEDGALARCMETLWRSGRGAGLGRDMTPPVARMGDEESYLFEVLERAWVGALRGECCVEEVERAVLIAQERAMLRVGQEIAQMYCIQCYLFHMSGLERGMELLHGLAARSGSARFLQEAQWWRIVQRKTPLSVDELERLHRALGASSLANKVTGRLLGNLAPGEVGALEEALTLSMGERLLSERVCGVVRSPRLVLHLDDAQVWRPGERDVRVLALEREQVGFALLQRLARGGLGEEVEKEALIKAVWSDVEEYHPLRHDNRLRVAIRKLRKELGEAFGEEEAWIETTSRGYAMGCAVRLVKRW